MRRAAAIPVSYHNHTAWSDGVGRAIDYLEMAARIGLREVGISDHLTVPPGGERVEWSMPPERFPVYVASLREVGMQHSEVVLRIGVEVDYFPETAAAVSQQIRMQDLDYVIGSVHFVDNFPIDEDAEHWEALTVAERDEMWRRYWERIVLLAESGWCDVVGHLDLPKKFGYRPSCDLKEEEGRALAAVAAAGLAIELNTNGWNKPVAEAYPSLSLLRQAQMRGVPVMISADAHRPEEVVQHFKRAYELARAAGYRELVRFAERKRSAYPL